MQAHELELTLGEDLSRVKTIKPVNKASLFDFKVYSKSRIAKKELLFFTFTLARLLQGGVPLLKGLEVINTQFKASAAKQALLGIQEQIKQGKSLSQAMESLGDVFPGYYIQMIKAGESSGAVGKVLESLSQHLEKSEETQKKIREALAYPAIVLMLGFVTLGVLLKFVVPRIAALYDDFGGELPGMTRFVLTLSHWSLPILACVFIAAILLTYLFQKQKELLVHVLLKIPVWGRFFKNNFLSQFTSMLSLQLMNGVNILSGVTTITGSSSFAFLRKDLADLHVRLSEGDSLSRSLGKMPWMNETSVALIQAGEELGKLPEALADIHHATIRELESQTQFLLKILEPLLILGVGGIVGFIVLSAILPILQLNEFVR